MDDHPEYLTVSFPPLTNRFDPTPEHQVHLPEFDKLYEAHRAAFPGPIRGWSIATIIVVCLAIIAPPIILVFFSIGTQAIINGLLVSLAFPASFLIAAIIFWNKKSFVTYEAAAKFFFVGGTLAIPVIFIEGVLSLPLALIKFPSGVKLQDLLQGQLPSDFPTSGLLVLVPVFIYMAFIVAALTEETSKVLSVFMFKEVEPPIEASPYSVMALMGFAGLGFGTIENYMFIGQTALKGDVSATLAQAGLRALLAIPLHSLTGLYMGSYFAERYREVGRTGVPTFKQIVVAMIVPVLAHGTYDVIAFTAPVMAIILKSSLVYGLMVLLLAINALMIYLVYKRGTIVLQWSRDIVAVEEAGAALV